MFGFDLPFWAFLPFIVATYVAKSLPIAAAGTAIAFWRNRRSRTFKVLLGWTVLSAFVRLTVKTA